MTSNVENWESLVVRPSESINHALQVIDRGNVQIALVLNDEGVLLGTVTDGDIRRGILKSIPLDAVVSEVMKTDALVGHP
ncbi:MAG: CBS domain-containing protein, partial [Proteobacteria bacterium]|nr:CBS domain-containing protein [Pseudomonadota bacterium]